MGSASAWWNCPPSQPLCVTGLQLPGRRPEAMPLVAPYSTSGSWRVASSTPLQRWMCVFYFLLLLPLDPCTHLALVPSRVAISTSDTACLP